MRFGNLAAIIVDIVKHSAAALVIPIYFMLLALVTFSAMIYYAEQGTPQTGCDGDAAEFSKCVQEWHQTIKQHQANFLELALCHSLDQMCH